MVTYDWEAVRADAIERFGETPAAPTEADIIEAFEEAPRRIIDLIDQLANERAQGEDIRSCWAVLRHRAYQPGPSPVKATDLKERNKRVALAEAWIRSAGLYLDRESELLSELFDEGRPLHPYQDQGLEERMTELWAQNRPRGEAAEADCERRALERVALRSQLKAETAARKPKLEAQHEDDPGWHLQPEPEPAEA